MNRRALVLIVPAVLAGGCAAHRTPAAPTAPTGSLSAPTASWDTDDGPATVPSVPPPGPAVTAVVAFVTAWARPDLAQPQWFAGVRALVTPAYARLLAMTDPANVPAHRVTGAAVVQLSTGVSVTADVPTDIGLVRVTTVLTDGRWLIVTAAGVGVGVR